MPGKRKLSEVEDVSSPKAKRVTIADDTKSPKPSVSRSWTTTNPDTGKSDGRLYRKDETYAEHKKRRIAKKKKVKKSKKPAVKKTEEVPSPKSGIASKPALSKRKTAAEKLAERAQGDLVDYSDLCQRFEGHHVVVVGGGEGVGQACALRFAQEGAAVTIWDKRRFRETLKLCEEVSTFDEATFDGELVDASDSKKLAELVKEYLENHGFIDVLVNAAGLTLGGGEEGEKQRLWAARVTASENLLNTVIPAMREESYGRIALLCASGKVDGDLDKVVAGATLTALAKQKALESASKGITINVMALSVVDSEKRSARIAMSALEDEKSSSSSKVSATAVPVPAMRAADCGEIAGAVANICSEEMSFTTGSVVDVTGGVGL
jgi:NAD(P)-dependent dehydrogenase (short-subunit alcohol dehydrogenase family)